MLSFPTDFDSIFSAISKVDPIKYGKTRNYVNGNVTYLSPYISRGVISTKDVLLQVCKNNFTLQEIESFVKELSWRDYFQRVWQVENIDIDIKTAQYPVKNTGVPLAFLNINTGINEIDKGIETLYETGYMHNHLRMYTAMLACNIGQYAWNSVAKWMFYHLLDGDWASNACSWQWVAGSNSSKKYYANQENMNKFTNGNSKGTYLDYSYEDLRECDIPFELKESNIFKVDTNLPENVTMVLDLCLPTYIYTYYNLDPNWGKDENVNRILLLEPSMFAKYPVSDKCLYFALELAENIPNLTIYSGEFLELKGEYNLTDIHFKEHPLNTHFTGTKHERDWLVPDVKGYYPSFFAYWKAIEKHIKELYFKF